MQILNKLIADIIIRTIKIMAKQVYPDWREDVLLLLGSEIDFGLLEKLRLIQIKVYVRYTFVNWKAVVLETGKAITKSLTKKLLTNFL